MPVAKHKVAVVKWGDAFIDTNDFDAKDAEKTQPVTRFTAGFFIAKNQHGIVLATDYYEKGNEFSAKMFIPWGMVDDWWELTESK